jgi:transcriptional regulator GlxA family with amidase domain
MVRVVEIVLFDGVEVLDFAGPFEVFSVTGAVCGQPPFSVRTAALRPGPVIANNGLSINPTSVAGVAPAADIVVVPGGFGTRRELNNPQMMDYLRAAAGAERLVSVCTGSLLLARAGLLSGMAATTHRAAMDELRALATDFEVRPDARVVDNGRVITSAGISAGIDMALHIVRTLLGVATAERTADYMQYDWRQREVELHAAGVGR